MLKHWMQQAASITTKNVGRKPGLYIFYSSVLFFFFKFLIISQQLLFKTNLPVRHHNHQQQYTHKRLVSGIL